MRRNQSDQIAIHIGRFDEERKTIHLQDGATFQDALNEANISLATNEDAYINGDVPDPDDDMLEDGDIIIIAAKKEGGASEDSNEPAEEPEDEDVSDEDTEENE